jgi:hypothetical protein
MTMWHDAISPTNTPATPEIYQTISIINDRVNIKVIFIDVCNVSWGHPLGIPKCFYFKQKILRKDKHILYIEWVSDCCLTPTQQFFNYVMARTSWFSMRWIWGPLCNRLTCLVGFLLKQQSAGRHVAPHGHIILIPSQPVFARSPYWCVLSGEATNTNFKVFGMTRSGLEPTIYCARGEPVNLHTTAVGFVCILKLATLS